MRGLNHFCQRIWHRLSSYIRPRMVLGWCLPSGVHLKQTRLSNMSYIEHPQSLEMGENVYIGHFCMIDASGGLSIGEGCQVTNYVSILTHSSHRAIRLYGPAYLQYSDHIGYVRSASQIGAYSFIGPHTVLAPGVKLGKGSLVHGFSYVKAGDYPDFAILAGQPAQVVGDTRDQDAKWLAKYPELKPYYKKWAGTLPEAC